MSDHQDSIPAIHLYDLSQRDIRALIFHLLYAMESWEYDCSLESIVDNVNRGFNCEIPYDSEPVHIVKYIIDERELLDEKYKPLLANWRFERISVPTKLILRYATWELLHTNTDTRIIINEAVELAKCFAERDAYRFINGILDKLVVQLRPPKIDHADE